MKILRTVLLGFSALSAAVLIALWVVSGRSFDTILFAAIGFLLLNCFYISISRPTLKTSDILSQASSSLAVVSLELQNQAREARTREVEAEQRRLVVAEHNHYKLQVAKDVLQHLRPKLPLDRNGEAVPRKLTPQISSAHDAAVARLPAPQPVKDFQHLNGYRPVEKTTQPVAQVDPAPSTTII
ncbi:hypothetical protein [Methylobacterium sp. 190mf]|uniref:hypothetical protein n=1 Tax=Methylobacterium sp. 190mf TaxID=1761798 RepID=UPI0011B03177|nr:hypothetical protein [Methylobacterium sp. 190mf]